MNRRRPYSAHASLFGTGSLVRQTRCTVIVAHPCDEVIGAGVLISRLKEVTVLHVTNGLHRDQPGGIGLEPQISQHDECASALELANVPNDRIVELGISNQMAAYRLVYLARKITAFLQRSGTRIVLTHPYDGGHPDHDATAFATHAAMRLLRQNGFTPPVLFEMALRPSRDGSKRVLDFPPGTWREATTLVLDEKGKNLKQQMLGCFRDDHEAVQATSLTAEKFRRPPEYDFSRSPLAGKPDYENFVSGITGDEWTSLARRAWSELFPANGQRHLDRRPAGHKAPLNI